MKSVIRLRRSIEIHGYLVTGTLALAAKREWEPALLTLAVQHGELTADLVVNELLGGRHAIALRLLTICTWLGLLEPRGRAWIPTEAGREAAATAFVRVPERGVWTLWIAEDPLLNHPIVGVSPSKEERSAYEERGKDVQRTFTNLPPAAVDAIGKVLLLPAGGGRAVRIDDLGKNRGERVDVQGRMDLTWTLTPTEVRCQAKGNIEGSFDADLSPPEKSHEDVWQTLLRQAGLSSQWDGHRRALWVGFDDTTDDERATSKRSVRIERPDIPGLGTFDDTSVEDVRVHPRSTEDANRWARWRLVNGLTTYLTDEAIASAYRDAAQPFEGLVGPCPQREDLAREVRGNGRPSSAYWWLQAPKDWSFEARSPK